MLILTLSIYKGTPLATAASGYCFIKEKWRKCKPLALEKINKCCTLLSLVRVSS